MTLKEEFRAGLDSGQDHRSLLELVHRHQTGGMTARESYFALEALWLEFGFDESEEDSPLRNELEYVMERVWYQGS